MKKIDILGCYENTEEKFSEIPEIMTIKEFEKRTALAWGDTKDSIWFLAKSLEQFEEFNKYFKGFMDRGTFWGYYEWLIDIIRQIDVAIIIHKKDRTISRVLTEKRDEFSRFSFVVMRSVEMLRFSLGMDKMLETVQLLGIDKLKTSQIDKITEEHLIFAEQIDKFHNNQVSELRESLDRWMKNKREI